MNDIRFSFLAGWLCVLLVAGGCKPANDSKAPVSLTWEMGSYDSNSKYYENSFVLKNISNTPLGKDWEIFYSQFPRNIRQDVSSPVRVEQVNATYFKMYPGEGYISLAPGDSLKVIFQCNGEVPKNSHAPEGSYWVSQSGALKGKPLPVSLNTVPLPVDNVLTYNKNFKKHGLEVMAGSSWTDSDYSNSWINGSHYRSDQIPTLNAANKISWDNTGTGASQWGIMSFFGRVAYNFDSKYLLTANLRADGSSKLHPDHRWGVFPSFSAAWRISSEKFMQNLTWIDDLKLRGGWGQTGNQSGIGDYAYLQRYNIGRIEWFKKGEEGDKTDYANAVPTISQANLRTSDLTWETTTQTNIGLDLTILNGRLTFNADYYYNSPLKIQHIG